MCEDFSCLVLPNKRVLWEMGVDSHNSLIEKYGIDDFTANPARLKFARVEITPDNMDYVNPDKWALKIDQAITPSWWGKEHEKAAWDAHAEWYKRFPEHIIMDRNKAINLACISSDKTDGIERKYTELLYYLEFGDYQLRKLTWGTTTKKWADLKMERISPTNSGCSPWFRTKMELKEWWDTTFKELGIEARPMGWDSIVDG